MFGLIEGWLLNKVGINCTLNKIEESKIFQDGVVLVNILNCYGLVDDKFNSVIHPTDKKVQCLKNLKLLKPLFDMLNLKYDEAIIKGIADSKPGAVMNFLYELYICLEGKQHLHFISKKNYENACQESIRNLQTISVNEVSPTSENSLPLDFCLEQPLINNADVIKWYKDKYNTITNKLNAQIRLAKPTPVQSNEQRNTKTSLPCKPCLTISSRDLEHQDLPDLDTYCVKSGGDENLLDYQEFIARYKIKKNTRAARKSLENAIQHELLKSTWKKIEEKQDSMYRSVLSAVLLKQSNYEKQILSKLIKTQNETHIQNENKRWAKRCLLNEQEQKIATDFDLKEKFEMLENNYKREQKRVLELHKKLYREKKEIKKRVNCDICKDIVDDIIELAVSASTYKSKNKMDVPKGLWNDWTQLFIKSQPILSRLKDLRDDISMDADADYDEIISFEKVQDEVLNGIDIDDYLLTRGKWFDSTVVLQPPDFDENCIAAIVYRLLSLKYPFPPSPPAPELPYFKVTGALINLNSPNTIDVLKLLLSKPGVHVFDTEVAVKKCIEQFLIETNQIPEEKPKGKGKDSKKIPKGEEGKKKKPSKEKNHKGNEKIKPKKNEKSEDIIFKDNEDIIINVVNKETQTSLFTEPKEEETKRTPLGLIGEKVYNSLKEGRTLDDTDMASVIVEYIKTLKEHEGWVLLGYPTTIEQAFHLEFALTAKKIPMKEIVSEEINMYSDDEHDKWSDQRKSRLFNCPLRESDSQEFESYFKILIIIEAEDDEIKTKENKAFEVEEQGSLNGKDVEGQDCTTCDLMMMKIFYESLGVYKHFPLQPPDLNYLKRLARVVLREDTTVEIKPSIDIFGEETLNKLEKTKKRPNKSKSSITDKKSKAKGKDKNKDIKSDLVEKSRDVNQESGAVADTNQHAIELINTSTENKTTTLYREQNNSNVTFITLPLNPEFGVLLATMWENIELCYIDSLKNNLYENRFINMRLHPYCVYVDKEMDNVINQPDVKQSIINSFQEHYNNISDDLLTLPDVKSQLHCKVLKVQNKLWEIADERKEEVEEKRRELIQENWLANEICLLINNFLSLIEIEFDRSVQTLHLINDYYLNMLGKIPPLITNLSENRNVGRINVETLLNDIKKISERESVDFSFDSKSNQGNIIANCLIFCYLEQKPIDMLHMIILEKINDVKSNFSKILNVYQGNRAEANGKPKSSKGAKSKPSTSKEKTQKKSKKDSSKTKGSAFSNQSEQDIENMSTEDILIQEWERSLGTEAGRLNFRIDLIYQRAKENLVEFYCYIESVFCQIYDSILFRYNTEISNINKVCDYLRMAIEEESHLHHQVVLGQDQFFISVKDNIDDSTPSTVLRELKEELDDCLFTIKQLSQLHIIFKISGPSGVIKKQPFCYILQDLVLLDACDNELYLPMMWNSLNEIQLKSVLDYTFGPGFGVDWRDFIIYNLYIPYPDVSEILRLRKEFLSHDPEETELISLEDYNNTMLWFENELPDSPEQSLRFILAKQLLLDVFKVSDTHVNYTSLLLYFCKDDDPAGGFKKALSLSLGKNVIVTKAELENVLQNEEEIDEIVSSVLADIIHSIVFARETAQVHEIVEECDGISDNKSSSNVSSSTYSNSLGGSSRFSDWSVSFRQLFDSGVRRTSQDIGKPSNIASKPKSWITSISVTQVLSVLNAAFFFEDKRFSLKSIYLDCLENEADSDGMIDACDLVDLPCIKTLFSITNKFKISRPCEKVKDCFNQM